MAKNQHSQNTSGDCEEVYIAISWPAHSLMSSGPALGPPKTFPVSATTSHAFRLKAAARQLPSSGEVIPVEIDPHLLPTKSTAELTKVSSKNKQEAASTCVPVQHQKKETMNDKFTEYINRVKHGMLRTSSNVGTAEISSGHDDEVWINHNSSAQMKIQKSSSTVGGKNVTFK